MNRTNALLALILPGIVALAGCGPHTQVMLVQPASAGPQRELTLASRWAAFDVDETVDRLLLAWPLPGARSGDRVFELYLRLPGADGAFVIGSAITEDERLSGLFYQRVGRLAGCSRVSDGMIRIHGAASGSGRHRGGEFDLTCQDGTRLTGRFRAERSGLALMRFEDHHAADIKHAIDIAASADHLADNRSPSSRAPTHSP